MENNSKMVWFGKIILAFTILVLCVCAVCASVSVHNSLGPSAGYLVGLLTGSLIGIFIANSTN